MDIMGKSIIQSIPGFPNYRAGGSIPKHVAFDTLGDLVNIAQEYRKRGAAEGCSYLFRGEPACFPGVKASLFTCAGGRQSECEHLYYQRALSSAPDFFCSLRTTFDKLGQMRHYEFPTRLLDVTENILTAWFMAVDAWCCDEGMKLMLRYPAGLQEVIRTKPFPCPRVNVIRVPNERIKQAESDLVVNLSNLAKVRDRFTIGELWHAIRQENFDFHEEAFWDCFGDLFTNWCVRPRMTNPRITMQQGLFILFGLSTAALRGRSVFGFRDQGYFLQKSADPSHQFSPLQPATTSPTDQIAYEAVLMPSAEAVQNCRPTGSQSQMELYVSDMAEQLAAVGYAPYTMYRDDFTKHAKFYRTHTESDRP